MKSEIEWYSEVLAAFQEKYPEAPCLGPGYKFVKTPNGLDLSWKNTVLNPHAAECVCVLKAMDITAWWVNQNPEDQRIVRLMFLNQEFKDHMGELQQFRGWYLSLNNGEVPFEMSSVKAAFRCGLIWILNGN